MSPSSKDLKPLNAPFFPNLFFKNQFFSKRPDVPRNTTLSKQVAIVTGANTGLGFEAADQLVQLQLSRLIIAVRSLEKGEAAAAKLKVKYPAASIDVWPLDMASYDSISSFAQRAHRDLARLDIAILNAGLQKMKFGVVPSTGHEEVIQVNYLSTVLLSILLLPILKAKSPHGSPGRLTIVNSGLSYTAKFPNIKKSPLLPSFDDPANFGPNEQYSVSKLLAHMFLFKLLDHVDAKDVVVNLVDPGYVKGTELGRGLPRVAAFAMDIFAALTARTQSVGASTYVDAAVVKGKESHGCYLMSWKIYPFASIIYSVDGRAATERLWNETMEELKEFQVSKILKQLG